MKPEEKQEMNIVVIMGLIGAAFGAFSYFTSPEAHRRGEGLTLPSAPINYQCRDINTGKRCPNN